MGCGSSTQARPPPGEGMLPKDAKLKADGTLDREAMLSFIFAHCDDDNDGKLSMLEFAQLADKYDKATVTLQLDLFAKVDKNADQNLSLGEFTKYQLESGSGMSDKAFYDMADKWITVRTAPMRVAQPRRHAHAANAATRRPPRRWQRPLTRRRRSERGRPVGSHIEWSLDHTLSGASILAARSWEYWTRAEACSGHHSAGTSHHPAQTAEERGRRIPRARDDCPSLQHSLPVTQQVTICVCQ